VSTRNLCCLDDLKLGALAHDSRLLTRADAGGGGGATGGGGGGRAGRTGRVADQSRRYNTALGGERDKEEDSGGGLDPGGKDEEEMSGVLLDDLRQAMANGNTCSRLGMELSREMEARYGSESSVLVALEFVRL
jgi:hypothetical protein